MTLDEYLDLVDWTGRQIVENKRGAIPVRLSPILLRLNVEEKRRPGTVQGFGSMFHRAAGRMESMIAAARRTGQRWLRGFRTCGKAFSSTWPNHSINWIRRRYPPRAPCAKTGVYLQ